MATSPERLAALMEAASSAAPAWSTVEDLHRLSDNALRELQGIPALPAAGSLRLSGEGVRGNHVRLDTVGVICQQLQRLVVSVGAALEGAMGTRGQVAEAIAARARLNMHASPAPGSLVLDLAPAADANIDRAQSSLPAAVVGEEPTPLAEASVGRILQLLEATEGAGPDGDELAAELNTLGPRSASAVKALTEVFATRGIDIALSWTTEREGTRVAQMTASRAQWLYDLVTSRRLDQAPVTIVGYLRTVSDRRAIEIETADGGIVPIKQPLEAAEAIEALADLKLHEHVRVVAMESVSLLVGGGEVRTLTLQSVERTPEAT